MINYTFLFSIVMSIWSLWYLPQFDFRPYHIGANIAKGMEIPKGAKQPKFDTTFILEKNGERKEFTIDNYPDSTWTFIDSKTVQTEEGYVPPIHDFSIEDTKTGEDITQEVIHGKGTPSSWFRHIWNLPMKPTLETSMRYTNTPTTMAIQFLCLTASTEKAIKHWQDITGAEYPVRYHRRDDAEDRDPQQPGTAAAEGRNHHPGNGATMICQIWQRLAGKPLEKTEIGKMPEVSAAKKIAGMISWFVIPLVFLNHRRPALGLGRMDQKEREFEQNIINF